MNRVKSSGKIPKILLVFVALAAIVVAIYIIVSRKPKVPVGNVSTTNGEEEPQPVYETAIGSIKFSLHEAVDIGDALELEETVRPHRLREGIFTREKFVEVSIAAENIGKDNIGEGYWNIMEVIDSEGRRFYPVSGSEAWIRGDSLCGALLKPGFSPTICTKIYEVAKISSGLKVRIYSKDIIDKKGNLLEEVYIDLGI